MPSKEVPVMPGCFCAREGTKVSSIAKTSFCEDAAEWFEAASSMFGCLGFILARKLCLSRECAQANDGARFDRSSRLFLFRMTSFGAPRCGAPSKQGHSFRRSEYLGTGVSSLFLVLALGWHHACLDHISLQKLASHPSPSSSQTTNLQSSSNTPSS